MMTRSNSMPATLFAGRFRRTLSLYQPVMALARGAYTGEGLVGLSWAFLRAGAHNVIAALWQASDSARLSSWTGSMKSWLQATTPMSLFDRQAISSAFRFRFP